MLDDKARLYLFKRRIIQCIMSFVCFDQCYSYPCCFLDSSVVFPTSLFYFKNGVGQDVCNGSTVVILDNVVV